MYGNDTDDRPLIVREADDVYESVRAINHATIHANSIPAPVVYDFLGNLKTAAGPGISQALGQVAAGLLRSLDTHDVYDDNGDPTDNAAAAAALMHEAAGLATQIGTVLEEAQSRISRQGYNVPDAP